MESFVYDSAEFQEELKGSSHARGEVEFLGSITGPGMTAVDVGANRGVTTVALSKAVGEHGCVWAFEPVPEHFEVLTTTLERNSASNVTALRLALTDRSDEVPFYQNGGGSGIVASDGAEELTVATWSIDQSVDEKGVSRVDVISADCEGSELLMLRGAERVLRRDSPRIFCEVHHDALGSLGQSAGALVEYLEGLGYHVAPLSVDDAAAEPGLNECTHILATREATGV